MVDDDGRTKDGRWLSAFCSGELKVPTHILNMTEFKFFPSIPFPFQYMLQVRNSSNICLFECAIIFS